MDVTILDRLDRHADERPNRPGALDPRSDRYDAWDTYSWSDYRGLVRRLGKAYLAFGHQAPQAVAIIGPNRMAWVAADLAAMAVGGAPAGIYATSTAEQAEYILADARAAIAVVCDAAQAEKVLSVRARLPELKAVVLFPGANKPAGADGWVWSWEEALQKGDVISDEALAERRRGLKPEDLATLIYTSGTTGPPKGVMLSHRNLTWTAECALQLVDARQGDRCLSYLPLAHIAEQMMTIHGPITVGATAHFVPVLEQLGVALPQVRPHFLFGVPRVWEKIQAKVEAGVAAAPPMRQKLFNTAKSVGLEVMRARFEGRTPSGMSSLLFPVFHKLVYAKLRNRLGLDESRILVTGAAPLSPQTRDWFMSLATPLSEVYGQSEGSGPTSLNVAGRGKIGTVGQAIPGVEVKIAGDGEILVKGPNIFLGYLNQAAATQEVLKDGWLHSGDVGELDAKGFLKITDRKKDLIITAGGKNIAPQNLEKELTQIPLVSQAVVIGDQRKFLVALLSLRPEGVESFLKAQGVEEPDPKKRALHDKVRAEVEREINTRVNPKLAQYETIKKFHVLAEEFSEAKGELTPTQKIKRKVVNEHYKAEIEAMYAGA
jgi:long-chain acyl-CoA synthetase